MKRLNPFTGQKFKFGEIREDGRVFIGYRTTKPISKKGTFYEDWVSKKSFDERYAKNRKWAVQNPERVNQLQKNWRDKNPSRMEELQRNWESLNRPKCNAKAAKRRAAKLQATPLWLTTHQLQEIDEYYAMAKELEKVFPWPQHVDHIEALQGNDVCGLHVPWNLQILSRKANLEKGNR